MDSIGIFVAVRVSLAVALAATGAFTAVSLRHISHEGLCVLISFAAGALLAVSFIHILPEAWALVDTGGMLAGALSGYLLFFAISRYVSHICPACSATHTEVQFKKITVAMVIALSLHSFMDGLAIYSGYALHAHTGLLILFAVAYHKFPEGMALTLVARGSGMGRRRAFLTTLTLESVTTFAGALAGVWFLVSASNQWIGYVLAHVAGGFIFLVLHALLSEVFRHHPRQTIIAALLGAGVIALMSAFLPGHAHA